MHVRVRFAFVSALALAMPLLSGCLNTMEQYDAFDPDAHYKNPAVAEGEYAFANQGSQVLTIGPYQPMPPETVYLVSTLPAYPGPAGSADQGVVFIPMAIWRPANVTEPVPIIIDAGPYYEQDESCGAEGQGECGVTDLQQKSAWLVANFLPHGYAVVQLAVRGTGTAGGCMDLLGDAEQHDLVQAIDWLAEQEWSNGNVAMIGASYDGSTPWSVAATGNAHLKGIVPTAGLPDIFDLMFHNGSAESRGVGMHSLTYWGYGFDDDFPQNPGVPQPVPWIPPVGTGGANGRETYQDIQNVCPEVVEGTVMGPYATATGDRAEQVTDYWTQRDRRQDVLDNYDGAVFLIHGLQDWNVDPHAAIPFNAALRAQGIDVTEWYGQWGHAFPDSSCAQGAPEWAVMPCRLDFAETMLHWFDRHLKGLESGHIGPGIQVQDNIGFWRMADSYPPSNPDWLELRLSGDGGLVPEVSGETAIQLMPPTQGGPSKVIELKSEPVPSDLRISGLPQIKLPFEVQGAGGEMAFWLFDEAPDGKVRAIGPCPRGATSESGIPCDPHNWVASPDVPVVGHGSMNLRYYAGGEQEQVLQPNTRYVAQLEFEPLEVLIPEGHRLTLWLFQFAYPDHATVLTPSPVTVLLGPDAILRLPTVDVDPTTLFPVPGAHFPTRENLSMMYVFKPTFAPAGPVLPVASAAAAPVVAAVCGRLQVCP
ncbi:MAG: CocE/NonD family hydrolase [Candidatus Thermoplasmatota archaeon]